MKDDTYIFFGIINAVSKDLFYYQLINISFSPDEFEEIDIDQDPSLSHHKETFHMTGPCIVTDSSLYGTDKCPCVCHTEHHSVKHCFTCAIQVSGTTGYSLTLF